MSVHFQPVPQKANQIIIDLSPSSSNRSCLTRRNIVIGAGVGIGLTVAAATAYFLTANSESLQSLHNIVKLVTTDSNGYYNCDSAFQAHWEHFKECGASANECMSNSIKLFGKLFCKPPTNSFGCIDDTSEKCKNNYFALARCDM